MTAGLLLVGASGLAREVIAAGIAGVAGILDDNAALHGTEVGGVPVVGSISDAVAHDARLLVCVGPSGGRRAVVDRLRAAGVEAERYATFVAGSVRIGQGVTVGAGSILLDGVVVTAATDVGSHVVIMPNCTITHDGVLEDFATLAAGVSLGGGVRVGAAAYLGMNACVRPEVTIGADSTVGMGAAVLRDVPVGQTWAGVPARQLDTARASEPVGVRGEHA
ncbi:LbetaH domain-containing protein [Microbacterium memoriense]|uniref:Acetyltransferase n=1 Tax=Microbacterium memoriense TaxID=2978350 RepID=A0ABT2PDD9_9MICO|nr:acetyltransferase [Microbacterium memoriense]MCT9002626.1 acetyltransferase [Microbacterium memoriense]